jgi:hypothetical protein
MYHHIKQNKPHSERKIHFLSNVEYRLKTKRFERRRKTMWGQLEEGGGQERVEVTMMIVYCMYIRNAIMKLNPS